MQTTPGSARALETSSRRSFALAILARTTFAWSIPGIV
jgi:hypothetical protein